MVVFSLIFEPKIKKKDYIATVFIILSVLVLIETPQSDKLNKIF